MAKITFSSMGEYIASQPVATRSALTRVRRAIHQAVPDANEMISYGIPAFKLQGRPLLYFAGWKEHYSLYPSTARLAAAFKAELAPYTLSKGTIRFPWSEPVPAALIARLAKFRAGELGERAPRTARTPRKPARRTSR